MDWSSILPYLVLALVAIRESLLLIAGLAAKRRTDNTAGNQSVDTWKLNGKEMINECLDEKLKFIHADLDELMDRRRRRR